MNMTHVWHKNNRLGKLLFLMGLALINSSISLASSVDTTYAELGNDELDFVFMGKCPNGELYRLKSYQQSINGASVSFYDYQGPAGQGTVQTKTHPKTMAARICRALAEIASDA
jgi:hypothetical protein